VFGKFGAGPLHSHNNANLFSTRIIYYILHLMAKKINKIAIQRYIDIDM